MVFFWRGLVSPCVLCLPRVFALCDTISLGLSLDAWNQTQACLCSLLFPTWPVYHQSNRYSASIWNNRVIQNYVIRWALTADPSRSTPGKTQRICVLIGLFRFSKQMSPVWTLFLKKGSPSNESDVSPKSGIFFFFLLVHKRYIIYIGDMWFSSDSEHLSDPSQFYNPSIQICHPDIPYQKRTIKPKCSLPSRVLLQRDEMVCFLFVLLSFMFVWKSWCLLFILLLTSVYVLAFVQLSAFLWSSSGCCSFSKV